MPKDQSFTTVRALMSVLANAMNMVNSDAENHHEQTAYLAYHIGTELGLDTEALRLLIISALLHDVGFVVVANKWTTLDDIEAHRREISVIGADLLRDLKPFAPIADIIEICQNNYMETEEYLISHGLPQQPFLNITEAIHIADYISTIWHGSDSILEQAESVRATVAACRGSHFSDRAVDAFLRVAKKEYIWMDFALNPTFLKFFAGDMGKVSLEQTFDVTRLMSRLIDFRSPFTAMHSAGVAASARELANLYGMSEENCLKMEIAGNLHDIGKLRVPNEILEKPGKLTDREFRIIKKHPYYTRLILMNLRGLEDIIAWASLHHEKLNGSGYPFHFTEDMLEIGAQVMAVADIFSAIAEDRPYRKPMTREQAMKVLWENVERGDISREIVALLDKNYDRVNTARMRKSHQEGKRYYEAHDLS